MGLEERSDLVTCRVGCMSNKKLLVAKGIATFGTRAHELVYLPIATHELLSWVFVVLSGRLSTAQPL